MAKAAEAFRTISEVAGELDLHKHVLRFWEVKFPQIKPMKRGGGRRYYRPADMELLRGIRHLLHAEGYTIKGVQKILRERGVDAVKLAGAEVARAVMPGNVASAPLPETRRADRVAATVAPDASARPDGSSHATESAPVASASAPRRAVRDTRGAGRAQDIAKAIDELQECRAILKGESLKQPADASTAKSKRAIRATG
jgi:DNA-binding transcriptional MerR regulator